MRKVVGVIIWALSLLTAVIIVIPILLGWVLPSWAVHNIRRKCRCAKLNVRAVRSRFIREKESRISIDDRVAEIDKEFPRLMWAGNGEAKVPLGIRLPHLLERLADDLASIRLVFRITRRDKARARAWRKRGILDDD